MAKTSGLGDRLFVAGYNLSGDIGAMDTIGGGPAALDSTGIDKSGMERMGGVRDGRIEYTAFFNPSTGQAHERLSALPTTDQIVTYCRGTTLGNPAASCVAKQIGYDGKRAADGGFTFSVSAQANAYGVEWGDQLTAGPVTVTAGGTGTVVDAGAGTAFGAQAYVHVLAVAGSGTVTINVESSSDNAVGDAYATVTGLSNTFSAVGGARLATAAGATIERYIRVGYGVVGFTSVTFSVMFVRNQTEVTF